MIPIEPVSEAARLLAIHDFIVGMFIVVPFITAFMRNLS